MRADVLAKRLGLLEERLAAIDGTPGREWVLRLTPAERETEINKYRKLLDPDAPALGVDPEFDRRQLAELEAEHARRQAAKRMVAE